MGVYIGQNLRAQEQQFSGGVKGGERARSDPANPCDLLADSHANLGSERSIAHHHTVTAVKLYIERLL